MSPPKPKFLFVLSSHTSYILNGEPHPSGWFLPEFAHPFNTLEEKVDIVIASPQGGEASLDTNSITRTLAFCLAESTDDEESMEFYRTRSDLWKNTVKLEDLRGRMKEFAGIFYVGGHGPMFDLAHHEASHGIIRDLWEAGKVVSAVCHGPAALVNAKLSDGSYLVAGSKVNGFTNREEVAFGTASAMPFMLEDVLNEHAREEDGGEFVSGDMWAEKVVVGKDGRLITALLTSATAGLAAFSVPQTQVVYNDVTNIDESVQKLISATEAYQGGLLSQAPIAIDFVPTHLATRKGFYDSLLLPSTVSESDAHALVEHVNNTLAIDNPRAVDTLISKKPQIEKVGDEGIIKAGIQLLLSDHLSFSDEVLKRTPADVLPQANDVVDVITVALRKGVDAFSG
ncbi:hypothetical protein KC367_g3429 [Hortaea werneckii]|uniref:D-lactate dehydratase n=1 Tax=Hortaea werneckii EXF-2000 TaxID=1157616 RepID=A0A1Z5TC80_HORWE|nr:hypothetical protein KC358_g13849 [Hortaea werneckii]OTA33616.1 hypothetical protein BTJ68_08188 [Hortaea werneckii EXF-2000]KAI6820579.1 hypothetical protein KC342_g13541 [Hortaea werneckii]KAI6821009.1 hypothetical protein KC350_g9710 [Hortaea werneckii]KAI6908497.1 hypothetical protein KC348_g13817 [Hortaea werneckii]